jgi:hypothetical protein
MADASRHPEYAAGEAVGHVAGEEAVRPVSEQEAEGRKQRAGGRGKGTDAERERLTMMVRKLCAELDLVHVVEPLKQLPQTEGNWIGTSR